VGPLISLLIQMAMLGAVLAVALGAGWGLARLLGENALLALAAGAVATAAIGAGLWLFVYEGFQQIETDAAGVATVITSVVVGLWLAGLATGYALRRARA
jgi:hypothetical protein